MWCGPLNVKLSSKLRSGTRYMANIKLLCIIGQILRWGKPPRKLLMWDGRMTEKSTTKPGNPQRSLDGCLHSLIAVFFWTAVRTEGGAESWGHTSSVWRSSLFSASLMCARGVLRARIRARSGNVPWKSPTLRALYRATNPIQCVVTGASYLKSTRQRARNATYMPHSEQRHAYCYELYACVQKTGSV